MKNKLLLTMLILMPIVLANSIIDKYQSNKQKTHLKLAEQQKKEKAIKEKSIEDKAENNKDISPTFYLSDRRKALIQSSLGAVQILEISKPFLFNLQKPEHGLQKGDLVEFIAVSYINNLQQKQSAILSFHGNRLISVQR